jgi:hypothetical protein
MDSRRTGKKGKNRILIRDSMSHGRRGRHPELTLNRFNGPTRLRQVKIESTFWLLCFCGDAVEARARAAFARQRTRATPPMIIRWCQSASDKFGVRYARPAKTLRTGTRGPRLEQISHGADNSKP